MGYAIYLLIGTFVAGAISIKATPKNALTVPFTACCWPVYVILYVIHECILGED